MSPATARCPECGAVADRLQGSPRRGPHLFCAYPCGCWLTPETATVVARRYRALVDRLNEEAA